MKEIKVSVRLASLSDVVAALQQIGGLLGLTVSYDVWGLGQMQDHADENWEKYVTNAKLEIVAPDHLVETVVETIQMHAHDGKCGNGLILVMSVEKVVQVRTSENRSAQ